MKEKEKRKNSSKEIRSETNDSETLKEKAIAADRKRIEELEKELEKAKAESIENHNRFLRASAELENFKKRTAREMEEFKRFATEHLIKELLSVVDNLERAVASYGSGEHEAGGITKGVEMTLNEMRKILKKHNVSPIEALGKPFDPNFHQAVSRMDSAEHPENTVIEEFQKGYLLNDRLLRPAMVVVSKLSESSNKE